MTEYEERSLQLLSTILAVMVFTIPTITAHNVLSQVYTTLDEEGK